MNDPPLAIAWLVALHLAGDFLVLARVGAAGTTSEGRWSTGGWLVHAAASGLCALPAAIAWGIPGLVYAGVALLGHLVVDGPAAMLASNSPAVAARDDGPAAGVGGTATDELTHLGAAWSARAAVVLLIDQLVHAVVLLASWRLLLADAAPTTVITDLATSLRGSMNPDQFHGTVLAAVVAFDVVVVNVQAAALFVGTLLNPDRSAVPPRPATGPGPDAAGAVTGPGRPSPAPGPREAPRLPAAPGYRISLGPLSGRIQPDPAEPPTHPAATSMTLAPPLRLGRVIGIFERLLIAMLVVAHAEAAVALVIGVKTVARFRQLDDRAFAEYYLLGTLASVSIGVASGLAARLILQA